MPWIAKRPCSVIRDGKRVTVAPGEPLPEAENFSNPTLWCVWQMSAMATPKEPEEPKKDEGSENPDVNENPEGSEEPKKDDGTEKTDKDVTKNPEGTDVNENQDQDPVIPLGDENFDYMSLSIVKLRRLAASAQEISKDFSTDLKKTDKPELIVIIKSVKE